MRSKSLAFATIIIICVFACKKTGVNESTTVTAPPPPPPPVTAPLKLDSAIWVPGNLYENIIDTYYLHFNRKIELQSLVFKQNFCLPQLKHSITNNGRTVKFYNFLCGKLGSEYPFEFRVKDTLGNVLTDSVTFKQYSFKLVLPGTPTHYFITPDNNFAWVTTRSPNKLLCLGLNDTSFRKIYDLPFIPWKLVQNYANNSLYILPSPEDMVYSSKIFRVNPATGIINKVIDVLPDSLNHPQHQKLMARDIAFGNNGYGIILVVDNNYSQRWKIIDSRYNDSIYIHPTFGNNYLTEFSQSFTNYDGTKIYSLKSFGNCRLGVLDCNTGIMTELSHSLSSQYYSRFITVHKKKNDIFFGNALGQFIVSNGIVTGAVTQYNGQFDPEAAFSYQQGENNYIYYLNDHLFGMVNYNNGQILMTGNLYYNLKQVETTTDGKWVITRGDNSLTVFSTDIFHAHL